MNKILFFLLFNTILLCQEYPESFKQLSAPLFDSIKPITKLSDIKSIKDSSELYLENLENIKILGFKVDKRGDASEIKEYLFKLRQLQKMHDFILHQIEKSIDEAINKNDYELFIKLTKYEFDGFLKSRALLNKSIEFYKKNSSVKKIAFFDKKIKHKKLEISTTQEFFNLVSQSSYNSLNKGKKKKSVSLNAVDVGDYIAVYVENSNPYSVTVNLKESYNNLNFDKSCKNIFSLKSGEKKEYIKLYKNKGAVSYSYNYNYSWIIGSIDAIHDDDYVYRLPYARGDSHEVSQGYNGEFTHKGHSQYAIDFAMDEGTKIYAARDGVVVKTKSDSNKGGPTKEFSSYGNYITIEHSDFTFATYYHLKRHGVAVKVGDKIDKGDFIGYSGNTGYSSGPHLHFAVFKADSPTTTKTIPVRILSKRGIINVPEKGLAYVAK
jgi:hypothetical protein